MPDRDTLLSMAERWIKRRREQRLLRKYGGIQTCPWCRQCAQSGDGSWHFMAWIENPIFDVLTCSHCEGTSVWLFAPVMIYFGALEPPKPAFADRDEFPSIRARAAQIGGEG